MHSLVSRARLHGALAFSVVALSCSALAQSFTVIADGSVQSPLGAPFNHVYPPSIAGNTVVFSSATSSTIGIFRGIGLTSQTVSVANTPLAGTTGTIIHYQGPNFGTYGQLVDTTGRIVSNVAISGAAALASWNASGPEGAISGDNGVLMPGGSNTFSTFGLPSISSGVIAFRGGNAASGDIGVYTSSTVTLAKIADKNTAIPNGTGNFTAFNVRTSIHNGTVAFAAQGSGGQVGVYTSTGGPITRIADTSTLTPDASGTFVSFGSPVITSGGVSFYGISHSGARTGYYTTIGGGGLIKVVDSQTTYPGTAVPYNFSGFSTDLTAQLAGSGNRLVFIANAGGNDGQRGLFTWKNGAITKIIEGGTTVDGNFIYWTDMSLQPLDGDTLAFHVTTTGGGGYRNFLVNLVTPASATDGWQKYE